MIQIWEIFVVARPLIHIARIVNPNYIYYLVFVVALTFFLFISQHENLLVLRKLYQKYKKPLKIKKYKHVLKVKKINSLSQMCTNFKPSETNRNKNVILLK